MNYEINDYIVANGVHYKGSLKKIRKSKNHLQPIFEAFTNSLEAIKIQQRYKEITGEIEIRIEYKTNLFPNNSKTQEVEKIVVEDNGIGFNNEEFDRIVSLNDSRKGFSNKGTGRIQFLHFFDTTEIESIYEDEDSSTGYRIRKFVLSKSDHFLNRNAVIFLNADEECNAKKTYTKVTFHNALNKTDEEFYNNTTTEKIKDEIFSHYLSYFCENREALPLIKISSSIGEIRTIEKSDIPEFDHRKDLVIKYRKISTEGDVTIEDEGESLILKTFRLGKDVLNRNGMKIVSKGEIAKDYGIDYLNPQDSIDGHRYLFLLSGKYFDGIDGDTRGTFSIPSIEELQKNENELYESDRFLVINDIRDRVNDIIPTLYQEILDKKEKRKVEVETLKRMFLLNSDTLKSLNVGLNDTNYDILKKVYQADAQLVAKRDAKIKDQVDSIKELNPLDQDYEKKLNKEIESLVKTIPLQNKAALTHYVARRKLVLDLFQNVLDRKLHVQESGSRNIDEKILHNIIFQQGSNTPEESDLWLLNEDFIYFSGSSESTLGNLTFQGEKVLKEELSEEEDAYRLKQQGNAKSKRTDVLLFPDEGKCIIIEFKSPEVNISEHLNQINRYASLLNNLSKEKFKINTFYGYLIGENIDNDDVQDFDSDYKIAYKFDYLFRPYKRIIGKFDRADGALYTEIIRFSTLLSRAKQRNQIFIDRIKS